MRKKIGNYRKVVLKNITVDRGINPPDILRKDLNFCWKKDTSGENVLKINQNGTNKANFINDSSFSVKVSDLTQAAININNSTIFSDLVFDYTTPFNITKKENPDNTFENIALATKFELKSNYNFSCREYKVFSAQSYIEEKNLLNYYMILGRDLLKDDYVEKLVTLNNQLDDNLLSSRKTAKEYFSNYPTKFNSKGFLPQMPDNICISNKEFGVNLNTEGAADLFSNYISLNLYKDQSGEIMEAITEAGFNNLLMSKICETHKNSQDDVFVVNKINYEKIKEGSGISSKFGNRTNIKLDLEKSIQDNSRLKYFDMISFINSLLTSTSNENLFYDFIQQNTAKPLLIGKKDTNDSITNDINKRIFALKIDKIIKNNLRTYRDMVNGKNCYSEILSIAIEKKRDGIVVQTYFFENNESDLLKFIDTQIKSNKQYTYNIFYYVAVIGNSYKYNKINQGDTNSIIFQVDNNVDFKVIRVPVEPVVIDAMKLYPAPKTPPVPPIVIPITYKGVKNKIKFDFIKNSDSYKEKFVTIEQEDVERLEQLFQSQEVPANIRNPDTPILFKSELNVGRDPHILEQNDSIERYEIYKTTIPPTKFQDFAGKLHKTTELTSFVDEDIITNKKYYYMFRAKNSENFVSNPTNVYEIEIVENSGAIYHLIKLYDFDIKKVTDENKNFKKNVLLTAAFAQTMMNLTNTTSTANTSAITLGPSDPSIWNKTYKLRITSKDTGRKIDINFKMIYGRK